MAWAGDLTAAERSLAFGSSDKELGLSALRIPVTDGSPDSVNVATAKAAIANGAIVFATPWNAAGAMTSSKFASYATHLTNFVSYMKSQGVELYAIGVQNEPDYGAEASRGWWSAALCHDFLLNYAGSVGTKLMSCESFSYAKSYYDPILNLAARAGRATSAVRRTVWPGATRSRAPAMSRVPTALVAPATSAVRRTVSVARTRARLGSASGAR